MNGRGSLRHTATDALRANTVHLLLFQMRLEGISQRNCEFIVVYY